MEKLSLQEIISAVHGSYGYPADVEISDISTDTRTIKPGSLFIALKGENFDGHNFAAKAMELGHHSGAEHSTLCLSDFLFRHTQQIIRSHMIKLCQCHNSKRADVFIIVITFL